MSFISYKYILFLIFLFLCCFFTDKKYRHYLLLISSIVFCCSIHVSVFATACISLCINFGLGICIVSSARKNTLAATGVLINLLLLAGFKYVLPPWKSSHVWYSLGISYYTLQNIGYLLDVKNRKITPVKNILDYALYLLFFPKFIGGPIETAGGFLAQVKNAPAITDEKVSHGFRLILWGVFKKIVIANNISFYTSQYLALIPVQNFYIEIGSLNTLATVILLGFQLYADLSSYTDMARGAAKILGYDLSLNFANPFFVRTVGEFWRRWHMSLSNWFKVYVFYPSFLFLQRNINLKMQDAVAAYKIHYVVSISVTFILLGLWHNLSLNFLMVGIIQSIFLSLEIGWKDMNPEKPAHSFSWMFIYPFFVFICTMLFFFTHSLADAFHMINSIGLLNAPARPFFKIYDLCIVTSFLIFMLVVENLHYKKDLQAEFNKQPVLWRWTMYAVLVLAILYFGNYSQQKTFIYESF